ncbi:MULTISPECIES: DUF1801 domain-containing protein [unclassified Streptomyces]|uniref:DUF1801 domain-containing protein n=1 Tax=unclassified Streptomyces TaxID=2593676 RepID=UPI00225703E8|nr:MULTISPECIES: DUF1801 domain-containing protein [unclassified Streptomyces]MCX5054127.1 DUF1801 domain-containing protein [Streptomyces sp. NBC_00474]
MDAEAKNYIDGIAPEHRALFDRVHRLILEAYPEANVVLAYGLPTYRVGNRKLHVGVWQHGVSVYGWDKGAGAGLTSRRPYLVSGKGTIRLRSQDAEGVTDGELSDLIRASLGPGTTP